MGAAELAAKILADGLAAYIGDSLTIELASRVQAADDDSPRELGGWQEWRIIAPKGGAIVSKSLDYAIAEIADTKVGSVERIAKMRELYAGAVAEIAAQNLTGDADSSEPTAQPSAFTLTLDDLADRLSTILAREAKTSLTGQDSGSVRPIGKGRKSRKKLEE